MDFGNIEIEISEFLNLKITDVNTVIVPIGENDGDYDLPFGKRKAVIAFANEEPDPMSTGVGIIVQNTMVVFSVLLQSKTLRGDKGIYGLSAEIKKYLIGYRPTNGDPFLYAGMRFEQKVKNTFEYSVDFKTKGMVVEQIEEETGPLLKKVTFDCS